jgi:hypothetical protein
MLIYGRIETPTERHPMNNDVKIIIPDEYASEVCADMMCEELSATIKKNPYRREYSVVIMLPRGIEPDDEMRAMRAMSFGHSSVVHPPTVFVDNGIYGMEFDVDNVDAEVDDD